MHYYRLCLIKFFMNIRTILSSVIIVTLGSCSDSTVTESPKTTDSIVALGGDRDEHGCIASAGQVWSAAKESCIQVFSEGERLNPILNDKSAIISAFVVANADSTELELFLAELDKAPILKKKDAFTFVSGEYTYNTRTKELSIADTVLYRGE